MQELVAVLIYVLETETHIVTDEVTATKKTNQSIKGMQQLISNSTLIFVLFT